ncbi:MAG: N-acetylmuramoyl-L-alanine amidase [Acidobacteriaceae bacterium]
MAAAAIVAAAAAITVVAVAIVAAAVTVAAAAAITVVAAVGSRGGSLGYSRGYLFGGFAGGWGVVTNLHLRGMGLLSQGGMCRGCGWLGAVALVGLCCASGAGLARAAVRVDGARAGGRSFYVEGGERGKISDWDAAVVARRRFEEEPKRLHTRAEFEHVMNGFRAIYRGSPDDVHAAAAVEQVAELFEQMGREMGDVKSTQAAVGQFEYVAKAYPGDRLAAGALEKALRLMGPEGVPGAQDAAEAAKVRKELVEDYPREAKRDGVELAGAMPGSEHPDLGHPALVAGEGRSFAGANDAHLSDDKAVAKMGHPALVAGEGRSFAGANDAHLSDDKAVAKMGHPDSVDASQRRDAGHPDRVDASQRRDAGHSDLGGSEVAGDADATVAAPEVREVSGRVIPERPEVESGPPAVVTGIRHWSTASYTRVAIDLNVPAGEEVKYEAARVENPDRIFFDIEHARIAPELEGKSFRVTDDGFLERVRAAQFNDQVTRVVLDVHHVTEYSAFLLPNPYRLIIDIHGSSEKQGLGTAGGGGGTTAGLFTASAKNADSGREDGSGVGSSAGREERSEVGVSSLPPMPVTDGSASFGLPPRSVDRVGETRSVARPRVVIASKATAARPVPNTVGKSAADTSAEVADVSRQPGMVEATRRPTSKPIAETSGEDGAGEDHYVPRSRRRVGSAHLSDDGTVAKMGHPNSTVGGMGNGNSVAGVEVKGAPAPVPPPTADGETSLMRTLGLKIGRIVIDAGHGGHDSGTLGAGGIEEKNVVLDVALRLGKLLHDRLGAEVVYTRDDDTFVPLETRTAIANKAQADLFISVHANSSQDPTVRGVEVYYLNFTSDPEAMQVASRENAVSNESVHELSDLVKKIALKDKIDESRELAADVDASLYGGLRRGNPGLKNRGVKKAPFVVLIGANMPSILAEISFVTNPESAAKLETPEYRERVAESLYKGIARYAEGINGGRPRVPVVEQAER